MRIISCWSSDEMCRWFNNLSLNCVNLRVKQLFQYKHPLSHCWLSICSCIMVVKRTFHMSIIKYLFTNTIKLCHWLTFTTIIVLIALHLLQTSCILIDSWWLWLWVNSGLLGILNHLITSLCIKNLTTLSIALSLTPTPMRPDPT